MHVPDFGCCRRVPLDSVPGFVPNRVMTIQPNTFRAGPDERGFFGLYGGRFVAETLMPLILDLEAAYNAAKSDPAFHAELENLNTHYAGRPSPLYFAERLTEHLGGAKIYFKRDELNHTGSHKINNCLGQILLARRMGKKRIIAETGAGQHGVAVATVCALFDLPCVVYMGATDVARQKPNVFRMTLLGAEVRPVTSGRSTLKDAMNDALRDWVANVEDTFYIIGTAAGPHPYPAMVRDFQSVIGNEVREQMTAAEGRLPEFLSQPSEAVQECLHALVSLRSGDVADAARHAVQAEALRPKVAGTCDGVPFDDLRDVDDLFGPILEVVTADGRCAWISLADIASLTFQPPQRARDLLWRQAELVARDGQKSQVLIPALYPHTYRESDDTLRLGRQTQWKELAPGLVQGLGQRLWLVGEDVRPFLEIKEISFA